MNAQPIPMELSLTDKQLIEQWVPTEPQRDVAWELLVELTTRVPANRLGDREGSDREALLSLHTLFGETRRRLEAGGRSMAAVENGGTISLAGATGAILNHLLRPFLARWHPGLRDHESRLPADSGPIEWERLWPAHSDFRLALSDLGESIREFVAVLARACNAEEYLERTI